MLKWKNNNTKCYACDLEQPRAALGYDVKTFKTYCTNPYRCTPAHPNAEGETIELIPAIKMPHAVQEHYPENLEKAMELVIGKTVSTRLTPAQAMHVMKVGAAYNLSSVYETLAFIIERDLDMHEENVTIEKLEWGENKRPVFKPQVITKEEYLEQSPVKEEYPETPPAVDEEEEIEQIKAIERENGAEADNDNEWSF